VSVGPFGKAGRFWRGNLHAHSSRSDGRLDVEVLCRIYLEANYDFLAITDHFLEPYGSPTRPHSTRMDSSRSLEPSCTQEQSAPESPGIW
jgi:histidinol phosphatase-like PHP family hydrolase